MRWTPGEIDKVKRNVARIGGITILVTLPLILLFGLGKSTSATDVIACVGFSVLWFFNGWWFVRLGSRND